MKTSIALIGVGALSVAGYFAVEKTIREKRDAETERLASAERDDERRKARAREEEVKAASEARAARARGGSTPPPRPERDWISPAMSDVARGALKDLSERLAAAAPLASLLRIPVLGGDDTIFVLLVAAFVLGDACTLQDLLHPLLYPMHAPPSGFMLPSWVPVGLSAARLSEASAGAVLDFLKGLAAHRSGAAPPPGSGARVLAALLATANEVRAAARWRRPRRRPRRRAGGLRSAFSGTLLCG
jgi:hypothetical protein